MNVSDLQISSDDRIVVARLSGEIDLSNADSLGEVITLAIPNAAVALVLDLSHVDYFDSAGIRLIYQLREQLRARGQRLVIVIPGTSPAHDALALAGIGRNLESRERLEDAFNELS